MIAGIVLAAGASTRMGRPKQLLPVGHETLLAAALRPLLESSLDEVIVVLGAHAEEIRSGAGLTSDPRLRLVTNEAWSEGMASSLRLGIAGCGRAQGALVALGDQPGIQSALVERLIAELRAGAPLVVPVHEGRVEHPVAFSRELFSELLLLSGDVGGRDIVRKYWPRAVKLESPALPDVDTEADYRALTKSL